MKLIGSFYRTFLIMALLLGLDMSILDTALVAITSEFNAVDDIAWIGSAYFISQVSVA